MSVAFTVVACKARTLKYIYICIPACVAVSAYQVASKRGTGVARESVGVDRGGGGVDVGVAPGEVGVWREGLERILIED